MHTYCLLGLVCTKRYVFEIAVKITNLYANDYKIINHSMTCYFRGGSVERIIPISFVSDAPKPQNTHTQLPYQRNKTMPYR